MSTTAGSFDPVAALTAAAAAAKGADPQTVVGAVKSASSPHEAIMNVQAIAAYGNTVKTYDKLSSLQPSVQAAAWQALNSSEQDQLQGLGYHVPKVGALGHIGAGGDHGGIWSSIASGFHTAAHWAGHGVSDVLNGLGSPIRAVQHVYRASHVLSEEGLASKYGWTVAVKKAESSGVTANPAAFKDIFSPSAWAQAWRQTTTGATTLDPAIARSLNAKYGKSHVALAIRVMHAGATATVAATPAKTRQAMTQYLQDPAFKTLLSEVSNGRMSVGRNLVGSTFMNQHPAAGKYLSGGIDAAFDIAATPLNKVGEVVKAARVAKYGITDATVGSYLAGDASKMDSLLQARGVQRYVAHVGTYLEKGDYAGLGRFDPRLDAIAPQLQAEGVTSAAGFHAWLSGQAGMAAILSGKAARVSQGVSIMPHLSIAGWGKASIKEALQNGLDRLGDGKVKTLDKLSLDTTDVGGAGDLTHQDTVAPAPRSMEQLLSAGMLRKGTTIPGVSDVARTVRRLSTLIQTKPYIEIGSDADVANLRRFFQGFMPAKHVNDVLNVFMGSDVGTRYRIVQAARQQMFHVLGFYDTPRGADIADKLTGALDDLVREQTYSVGGLDQMAGDNQQAFRSAVLDSQLSDRMALPMPNQVRRTLRETKILATLHIDPVIAATRFMYYWRAFILNRPGFAVRFALTENLLRLLRTGPRKFIGSYLANGSAQTRTDEEIASSVDRMISDGKLVPAERDVEIAGQRALAIKPLLPYHPVERTLSALGERVPEGMRPFITKPAEFYGSVLGATTRAWARDAQRGGLKLLGLDHYITAATHLYTHQPVEDAFNDVISATHGVEGYMWSPGGALKAVRDNADMALAMFKKSSHYSEAAPNDPLWRMKWQFSLDQVAQSKLGQAVLGSMDKTTRTQERAVLRVLNDPAFAEDKAAFARASRLPDGRVVGVDATQHEADLAFARTVRKHVNALVRSSHPEQGPILQHLVDEMVAHGRGPEEDTLNAIHQRDVPQSVYGPDILQVQEHKNFLHKSFEVMVGKPANWLARQPHFIQAYAEALPAARELAYATTSNVADAEKMASDIATQRAVSSVIPFIHNPSLRTQFEDTHRILMPFLFAQRQFIHRWVRLMEDSPDAIRKIQLTMNGLRSTGFIRKDTSGHTYFYYPGSEYPQELLTHVLTMLGIKASVPMVVPFTGQVQYLMPGLANPVTPSVGPFAAVSVKELARLMPELNSVSQKVLGQGASTPEWQQFTPTVFNRLWNAIAPEQRGSELASTTMQAIKYLDNAGYTLPTNASPPQVEQYVSRVRNWARSLLVIRAALGFVLPATPKATLDPKGLDGRFRQLMNELPYTQAVAEFIKEHPTATAYTVSQSTNEADGQTPATAATKTWMDSHLPFVQAHPLAAAWFVPRSTAAYTAAAYREQIALGMRKFRTDTTFMDQVIMSRAATAYYTTVTRYEKAYTATTSSAQHQQLTHWYDGWKAGFFKLNPIFGDYITSAQGHIKRLNTIEDVKKALTTPQAPKGTLPDEMRTVLNVYDNFLSSYDSSVGLYSTAMTQQRKQIKAQVTTWGNAYAASHPQVKDFWTTVVRIEVESQK